MEPKMASRNNPAVAAYCALKVQVNMVLRAIARRHLAAKSGTYQW